MKPRKEVVTVVRQSSVNGKVVAALPRQSWLLVHTRASDGSEYVEVDGRRVELIKGVAVTGGQSSPLAKPF